MKIVKHTVVILILFASSFSLVFFGTDKIEYRTVDNYVNEPRIYVTKHGECYHASGCQYLSRSRIEMGLYYAKSHGYKACSYCNGLPYGTTGVNYYKAEIKNVTNEVAVKSNILASFTVIVYISVCTITYVSKNNKKKIARLKI